MIGKFGGIKFANYSDLFVKHLKSRILGEEFSLGSPSPIDRESFPATGYRAGPVCEEPSILGKIKVFPAEIESVIAYIDLLAGRCAIACSEYGDLEKRCQQEAWMGRQISTFTGRMVS